MQSVSSLCSLRTDLTSLCLLVSRDLSECFRVCYLLKKVLCLSLSLPMCVCLDLLCVCKPRAFIQLPTGQFALDLKKWMGSHCDTVPAVVTLTKVLLLLATSD